MQTNKNYKHCNNLTAKTYGSIFTIRCNSEIRAKQQILKNENPSMFELFNAEF